MAFIDYMYMHFSADKLSAQTWNQELALFSVARSLQATQSELGLFLVIIA